MRGDVHVYGLRDLATRDDDDSLPLSATGAN
jgi:hypothetical protein